MVKFSGSDIFLFIIGFFLPPLVRICFAVRFFLARISFSFSFSLFILQRNHFTMYIPSPHADHYVLFYHIS